MKVILSLKVDLVNQYDLVVIIIQTKNYTQLSQLGMMRMVNHLNSSSILNISIEQAQKLLIIRILN